MQQDCRTPASDRLLRTELLKRSEGRSEDLSVEAMRAVRDWKQWLSATGVTPYHAWMTRAGIEAPHSFTWKLRRDLTGSELGMLPLNKRGGHPGDVFCLVKNFIKDTVLQQPPVLAMPQARLALLDSHPHSVADLPEVSADRRADLRKLALAVQSEMPGSADYLEFLAARRAARLCDLMPVDWLPTVSQPELPLQPTANAEYPNLPEASWELKVRFSRI